MDLYEFQDYCTEHPFSMVWFYTEDQEDFKGWEPLVLRLQIPQIVFHMTAPGIELRNGETRVFLRNVVGVTVDEDNISPGRIVNVLTDTIKEQIFTLLLKG